MKFLVIPILFIFIIGCGKKEDSLTDSYSCHTPTNNLSGCCSGHGGPKACGEPGDYMFTNSKQLVCSDNKISPSCKGIY